MPPKLHGRAFYESLGSPKHILAPMVDQSEFAWRLLTRSFLPPDLRTSLLAYSPMLHAKLFAEGPKYRLSHFQPLKPPLSLAQPADIEQQKTLDLVEDAYMDGNPKIDRPLIVQFCANDPDFFLEAAKIVQPYCDAVDLNLGCPQGIARRGHYGSFLQEDWTTIAKLIRTLHENLDIPVTAKMRVLETKEKTLEYARMILEAGASIITVHGRQRDQKGHKTGLADWSVIRYLRENLPAETVIFANGNILQHGDIQRCLDETKADGVMSAEGNLYDPSIFAEPPAVGEEGREYWRGRDGKGGYRCDAVLRRYLDIIHRHVLQKEPPARQPLFLPTDDLPPPQQSGHEASTSEDDRPPSKKQKTVQPTEDFNPKPAKYEKVTAANFVAMQAHCFHILRPLVSKHHNVRDALARCRAGDIEAYENVLTLTEEAVKSGLIAYERDPAEFEEDEAVGEDQGKAEEESSVEAVRRCKRPWWICQPYVRPLPKEALEKGSLSLSKKERKRLEDAREKEREGGKEVGLQPGRKVEEAGVVEEGRGVREEVAREGLFQAVESFENMQDRMMLKAIARRLWKPDTVVDAISTYKCHDQWVTATLVHLAWPHFYNLCSAVTKTGYHRDRFVKHATGAKKYILLDLWDVKPVVLQAVLKTVTRAAASEIEMWMLEDARRAFAWREFVDEWYASLPVLDPRRVAREEHEHAMERNGPILDMLEGAYKREKIRRGEDGDVTYGDELEKKCLRCQDTTPRDYASIRARMPSKP